MSHQHNISCFNSGHSASVENKNDKVNAIMQEKFAQHAKICEELLGSHDK